MLELFFVRILRQQENLGVKKPNNCSYSFRLQVQESWKMVSRRTQLGIKRTIVRFREAAGGWALA